MFHIDISIGLNIEQRMASTCLICTSTFSEHQKRPVECPYCKTQICYPCAQKCALTWASNPKCANCMKSFTQETIETLFPKSFRRGPLRQQAIQNLLEQEISLLPQTIQKIAREKARQEWTGYFDRMKALANFIMNRPMEADLERIYEQLRLLQQKMRDLQIEAPNTVAKERVVQHRSVKCSKEECRGFIPLSGPGHSTCAVCTSKLCTSCYTLFSNQDLWSTHKNTGCDAQLVASVKLIQDSCVPCPKCGTSIQKTDGCNQMWCTVPNCNTAFDYKTGRIINGPIHNPHYHEFLRNNGDAIGQIVGANVDCNGPNRYIFLSATFQRLYQMYSLDLYKPNGAANLQYDLMNEWCRELPHAHEVYTHVVNDPNATAGYTPDSYEHLRRDYLNNNITKKHWASSLSHKETIRHKKQRLRFLYDMFLRASTDLFQRFIHQSGALLETHGIEVTGTSMPRHRVYGPPNFIRHPGARPEPDIVRYNGNVKVLPCEIGIPVLEEFNKSMEALRVYLIRELLNILRDYSDTYVSALEWNAQQTLSFSKHLVSELERKYVTKTNDN